MGFSTATERMRLFVVALAIAAMVGVPALRFDDPPPARFGWQMFSDEEAPAQFTVVLSGGERRQIDPNDFVVGRPDVPWAAALPGHLCDRIPVAVEVEVRSSAGDRIVPCG